MPARNKPKTLEDLSLESIGENIFQATIYRVTSNILRYHLSELLYTISVGSRPNNTDIDQICVEYGLGENAQCVISIYKEPTEKEPAATVRGMNMIQDAIFTLQTCLFVNTAHYFHFHIAQECIVSIIDENTRSKIYYRLIIFPAKEVTNTSSIANAWIGNY